MFKKFLFVTLLLIGFYPKQSLAQKNLSEPDRLKFESSFFEALKQKGIENYDRAIKALLKCIALDDSESVLYYELGKNYIQLKNFGAAEDALKKAIAKEPENEWYLDELLIKP